MRELKIGRGSDNDIILEDASVSRQHASIVVSGSEYTLRDNNSSNGTFVNGMRINGVVRIQRNDIVKAGNALVPWMNYIGMVNDPGRTKVSAPVAVSGSTNAAAREQTLPNASGALVCGIIGVVFSFLGLIGVIGLILSIIATALGGGAVSKYKRNPAMYTRSSFNSANAGMILGIIGICIFIIVLIIILVAVSNVRYL